MDHACSMLRQHHHSHRNNRIGSTRCLSVNRALCDAETAGSKKSAGLCNCVGRSSKSYQI
ncbi:hypothetical protein BDV12DRAFT_176198 [Aspergillus spectabilis]